MALQSHREVSLQDEAGSLKLSRLSALGKLDLWTLVDAGDDQVFIQSYQNRMLQDVDGKLGLTDENWPMFAAGDSEKWKLIDAGGGKSYLQSHRNQFLSDNWWHPTLNKEAGHNEAWSFICDPNVSEMCAGPFKTCAAWGDPHYTSTFEGGHFDNMGLGPFKLAANADKSFELQGFQAPLGPYGATGFAGFAMKIGTARVTIVSRNVTIDGSLFTGGSHPSGLQIFQTWDSRDTVTLNSADNCLHLHFRWVKTEVPPGYYHNLNIAMEFDKVAYEGLCASNTGQQTIQRDESLFGSAELDSLCSMAGIEDCATFSEPPGWKPLAGPRDACERAGIPYDDAVSKCGKLDSQSPHFSACIFDYCATDGDESMVTDAINAEQQDKTFLECKFEAAYYPLIGEGQCKDEDGNHESIGMSNCGTANHWGCKNLGQCEYACSCREDCGGFQFHYGGCWLYSKMAKPYVKANAAVNRHKCYVKQALSEGEKTTTTTTTTYRCPKLDSPVALKSHRDVYLQDKDGTLTFAKNIGKSEVWVLVDAGDGKIFIKSHRNQMLKTVDLKLELTGDKGDSEKWILGQAWGKFNFKSHNDHFLSDNWWHPALAAAAGHNELWTIVCDPEI